MNDRSRHRILFALAGVAVLLAHGCARNKAVPDIFLAADAGWPARVAAAEIRRYVYLRTGVLPGVREAGSFSAIPGGALAVLEKGGSLVRGLEDGGLASRIAALGPEDY